MHSTILVELKKIVLLSFVFLLFSTAVVIGFVRPVVAEETIYIRPDGTVEGTDKIQRDGNAYTFTDNIFNQSIIVERDNIVVDGAGYTLQGTEVEDSRGVSLYERSNITIKNIKIKKFWYGISLYKSSNNTISGNNLTEIWVRACISLDRSSNNTISRNNITANKYAVGVMLESSSSNNRIFGNNITGNTKKEGGIYVFSSHHNNVYGNNIANNWDGIVLWGSSNHNSISGNNITENYVYGLFLDVSSDNFIAGNNIGANNGTGISFVGSTNNTVSGNNIINNEYGIGTWSITINTDVIESSDNIIYHNNFIDNTKQVSGHESTNIWDDGYPSGGNYWSDYKGTDNDGDGIGDIPYFIAEGNQDNYPLVPYWVPPSISIISPENRTYTAKNVSLTFTVSKKPPSWIGYSFDGQPSLTIAGNTTLTELSDGMYSLTVYANDTAGNIGSSDTIYFTINSPPSISIQSPQNKTYDTTDIPLNFTVDESVLWIAYSLDEQANVTITGNTTLTELSEGSHSLVIYAEDTAGNTGVSKTIIFRVTEPFPTTLVVAVVAIVLAIIVSLAFYIRKKRVIQ